VWQPGRQWSGCHHTAGRAIARAYQDAQLVRHRGRVAQGVLQFAGSCGGIGDGRSGEVFQAV
jgi:hypothetical protein